MDANGLTDAYVVAYLVPPVEDADDVPPTRSTAEVMDEEAVLERAAVMVQKVQRGRYHREVAGAMKVMEAAEAEEASRAAPTLAERLSGRHRRAT